MTLQVSLRGVLVVDPTTVKEEAKRADRDAGPLGVRLLELRHARSELHAEVDFVRVLKSVTVETCSKTR